jgi:hypothetical protein
MSEMTPEERSAELSGTREWYDAVTTGTQREIDMLVATAIEDAEQRGYVKGLFAALDSTSDNETAPGCRASIRCMIGMTPSPAPALIQPAEAQTSPAKENDHE